MIASHTPRVVKKFLSNVEGLAAVEFSFIAPIMLVLFFGVVEGSDALSASRRVTLSANTLADLVAQESQITGADLDDIFVGMADIVTPQDANVDFQVFSIIRDPVTENIVVDWSYDSTGASPSAQGDEFTNVPDATLLDNGATLIVTNVSFDYSSRISQFIFSNLTLERSATRLPRASIAVQYCPTAATCP